MQYIKAKLAGKLDDFSLDAKRQLVGGTPKQQSAIADETLRELRVSPLDSAESLGTKLQGQLDESGRGLESALNTLDESGVRIPPEKVLSQYDEQIMALKTQGKFREAQSLADEKAYFEKNLEDVFIGDEGGLKSSLLENAKREDQAGINYQADSKPKISGMKGSASIKRQGVEDAAMAFDENLGRQFVADKQMFGKLDPVIEATQTQTMREGKKELGRFFDPTRVAPEIYKSTIGRPAFKAWSADKIGDIVKTNPQIFGKYAGVLQNAAKRGPQGIASTHFLLSNQDPAYRALLNQVADQEERPNGFNSDRND